MMHAVVQKLERFGPLSDADKDALMRLVAAEREVPARTDLIREGDSPAAVHLVTSGLACRYKRFADGRRQIVALLIPGDFCDLQAIISRAMDHSIATIAPSRIVDVAERQVHDLLSRPTLARSLFKSALVDAAILRAWIATIGQRSAEQRIAHLFCELHARFAAVGRASADGVDLPLNQKDLGEAVGLSPVHTNRSLKSLTKQGLIFLAHRKLIIRDPVGLEAMCDFRPNYLHFADDLSPEGRSVLATNGIEFIPENGGGARVRLRKG